MSKEDLINQILDNQIFFQGSGHFAAVMFQGQPVIMTDNVEDYENGLIKLSELSFEQLEYIAQHKSWMMEEPTIYC